MFSLRLKELREAAGLSQTQLAMKIGVKQSTVGMWESGKNKPQNARLEAIAALFDVSIDYLLGRSDVKKEPKKIEYKSATTSEGRIISWGIDNMDEEARKRALILMRTIFPDNKYFQEDE